MSESKETKGGGWLIPILVLGVPVLVGLLICNMGGKAEPAKVAAPSPAAPVQVASPFPDLGSFVTLTLPSGITVSFPERGMEGRFLKSIQDPAMQPNRETWFDFDRLLFDTSSATLRPESQPQLIAIATILKAYPTVSVKLGGYTDNTGGADMNLKLSQARADSLKAELQKLGVAQERLAAEGYGEQYPIADNATPEGRAKNRRDALRVTKK
jgi:outer membrane protein OmpA-like peptidoglycan-associated protein